MSNFTRKYLTIDDLLSFCMQSKLDNFSAKDAGGPIIVQSFGKIKTDINFFKTKPLLNGKNIKVIENELIDEIVEEYYRLCA